MTPQSTKRVPNEHGVTHILSSRFPYQHPVLIATGGVNAVVFHGLPALWEHDGKLELVSEAGDVVQGFDPENGERLWSSQVIGEGKVPSTVLGEGLVFTAGGWGGRESIKAFRLGGRGDLGTENLVWEQNKGMPKIPSLLYVKPHLFAITDGGIATYLQAATGEIVWQKRLAGNFPCPLRQQKDAFTSPPTRARQRFWKPAPSSRSWPQAP